MHAHTFLNTATYNIRKALDFDRDHGQIFVNRQPANRRVQLDMDIPIRNTWKAQVSCICTVTSDHMFDMVTVNTHGGMVAVLNEAQLDDHTGKYALHFPTGFPLGLLSRTMVQFRRRGPDIQHDQHVQIEGVSYPKCTHDTMP